MDKESLEREYKQWVREYKGALTEDAQWRARKGMARIEKIAAEEHGFEFADQLHKLLDEELQQHPDVPKAAAPRPAARKPRGPKPRGPKL